MDSVRQALFTIELKILKGVNGDRPRLDSIPKMWSVPSSPPSSPKSEFSMKVNFVIEPFLLLEVRSEAEVLGLSSKQYVAKFYSEFGAVAFEDIAGLVMHVRQEFQ
ncbi:hypothetical protein D3C72_421670 [compost metagenome]